MSFRRLRRRPSPAAVLASIALFVALDGPATAARLIDGGSIAPRSITAKQVKANTLTGNEVRNGSLGTGDLSRKAVTALRVTPAGSVGSTQLAAHAVTADKVTAGAIGTTSLADQGVQAIDLADGAVGMNQLAMGAVTSTKIADGAVGGQAVADGSLQTHDVGEFAGSVKVDFAPFVGNDCQVAKDIVPAPTAAAQANNVSDDVVFVSPAAGWPDPIILVGNPGANNTLRIVACRIGGDPSSGATGDDIDPGETVFQYVAIDQP
jgi:hypothetical protein